jgi:hypothetical protein
MSANAAGLPLDQPRHGLRFPLFVRNPSHDESKTTDAVLPPSLDDLLAPVRWLPSRHADPELRKVLAAIQTHLSETRRLLASPQARSTPRNAAAERELTAILQQDPTALAIDSAWELAGALKRLNVQLGDEPFLASRLEFEQGRADAHWHGWNAHFDAGELRELVDAFRSRRPTQTEQAQAIDKLTFLYLMRDEAGRDRRARAALKRQYLTRLAPLLLLLFVGLGVAVNYATKGNFLETILLTACAGALGSTLSGVFKVRDHLVRLDELRGFWPAMRVQPIVGACAGLFVFLILDSHAIQLGAESSETWSGRGVLAFAAGFSEPFFLGIVQRVAVIPDRAVEGAKSP